MITVAIRCPVCDEDVEVNLSYHRGSFVPYGSTRVRLPDDIEAENVEHACARDPKVEEQLIDAAIEAASEYEAESRFDTCEEKEDYFRD